MQTKASRWKLYAYTSDIVRANENMHKNKHKHKPNAILFVPSWTFRLALPWLLYIFTVLFISSRNLMEFSFCENAVRLWHGIGHTLLPYIPRNTIKTSIVYSKPFVWISIFILLPLAITTTITPSPTMIENMNLTANWS